MDVCLYTDLNQKPLQTLTFSSNEGGSGKLSVRGYKFIIYYKVLKKSNNSQLFSDNKIVFYFNKKQQINHDHDTYIYVGFSPYAVALKMAQHVT